MAFGQSTFTDASGAVADIFGAIGDGYKAQGDLAEAGAYGLAAQYASQNRQFTKQSTAIKQVQEDRQIYQGIGTATADITGSGFQLSGSALDILRSSAAQGALTKQVIGQQGLITEAGYTEQVKAYHSMERAANLAADAADTAGIGSIIGAGLKGVGMIAALL